MSLILEQWAFVQDQTKLVAKALELGYVLTDGESWRPESQAWINSLPANSKVYAITPDGTKRDFPPFVGGTGILKSKHGDRLAKDFNIFMADNLTRLCTIEEVRPLGEYWETLSNKNRWGGHFQRLDSPHFERNL